MARHRSILIRTWHKFGADHGSALAAAISYYVLFAIVPLVTFLVAIFGFVMRDPQRQQDAVARVFQWLPLQNGPGQNLVLDSIRSASSQSGTLTLIGIIGLIWASSGLFSAIREALNIAWEVEKPHGFIRAKLFDLGGVLGLGILFLLSMAATIALHVVETPGAVTSGTLVGGTMITVIGLALPALVSFFAFLMLYRYVPNVHHTIGDVWPGAVVAALLFELSKHAFAFYVSHFNHYQAIYGALGAVMLFMLWCYLASYIMLLGAEWAVEHEWGRHGVVVDEELAARRAWAAHA